MAIHTYDEALRRLLAHEGGYTNHPSDPGGPTNFGITIHDYRRYVKADATAADVRSMKIEEAKAIYRAKYWDKMCCDALPAGVDYCVFDYGVNSGVGRAPKVLQRALGVADDGIVGPITLKAARARDAREIVAAICDERLRYLKSLKTWRVFGRGWSRRVAEVKAAALAMTVKTDAAPAS
jgi:lysozyme family protein